MMSPIRPGLLLSQERVEACAARLFSAVRAEVPAYGAIADPEMERDVRRINRLNVELFFRALSEDRPPTAAELLELEESARRRLHQAVPLEAIFHSYRVGVRVLWECLLEVAPPSDHGRLGSLALEYADRVSTAAAQAYLEERQRVAQSRHDAARLLLTRVIQGEAVDEEALTEASALGLDLRRRHAALVATRTHDGERPTHADLLLAGIQRRLQAAWPQVLAGLLSVGLVAVVPQRLMGDVEALLERELAAGGAELALAVGIGTPGAGARGVAASYREAGRAHALGAVVHPDRRLHRYRELRLYDLFKEGETMDAFVGETLGPLLALPDGPRGRALETLEVLFAGALNRKQAARRLGVHQNTLSNRLRRLERLLGGDLHSGELCFRLQLALRLLPLTTGRAHPRA
jgi:sugar diacid utilization regulator